MEDQQNLIEEETEYKNAKEKLYDKIPLTHKAMDIICKILIALFAIMMVYLVILGGGR